MGKIYFFILLLVLINFICYAEISYDHQYSLSVPGTDDEIIDIWLADYDEDGEDHIYVTYYDYYSWKLIEYDMFGDTISVFSELLSEYQQFLGCMIFKSNNTLYKAVIYSDGYESGLLEVYDYTTGELLASATIFENWLCWDV